MGGGGGSEGVWDSEEDYVSSVTLGSEAKAHCGWGQGGVGGVEYLCKSLNHVLIGGSNVCELEDWLTFGFGKGRLKQRPGGDLSRRGVQGGDSWFGGSGCVGGGLKGASIAGLELQSANHQMWWRRGGLFGLLSNGSKLFEDRGRDGGILRGRIGAVELGGGHSAFGCFSSAASRGSRVVVTQFLT